VYYLWLYLTNDMINNITHMVTNCSVPRSSELCQSFLEASEKNVMSARSNRCYDAWKSARTAYHSSTIINQERKKKRHFSCKAQLVYSLTYSALFHPLRGTTSMAVNSHDAPLLKLIRGRNIPTPQLPNEWPPSTKPITKTFHLVAMAKR